MKNKFISLALAVIGSFGIVSCTNELTLPTAKPNDSTINLTKNPDVVAYSGEQLWGSTFGAQSYVNTRSFALNINEIPEFSGFDTTPNGSRDLERWQGDRNWSKPHDIIESERDYVLKYLQENPNGGYKTLDIYNYIIQVVGGGHHDYYGGLDHNKAEQWVRDATSKMNQCYIDGFFTQYNNGHDMNTEDCILIKNVKATNATYHDSNANLTQENLYSFYFITFPDEEQYGYMAGKTGLYLCYDYATNKENEKWGVTADGVYDDWVIKLSPADGSDIEIVYPEKPNDDPIVTPEEPKDVTNHVEVNLSIEEHSNIDDLIAHLSIHVRAITDVEIFIPVPSQYYCDVDDMAIVEKHEDTFFIHGGPKTTEYNINGTTVTLTVDFESNGIRITTDGIDENVITYLQENHGDGITFEVWNYFNETIDVETLKYYLDQSTIKFLDSTPDLYVNAFTDHDTGKGWENDCTVSIVDEQSGEYSDPETDYWYNGSQFNELYYNKELNK